jgi:probable DNA metabolism protein
MMLYFLYDGSFDGFLSAIFVASSEHTRQVSICKQEQFKGDLFAQVNFIETDELYSDRVWRKLHEKIPAGTLHQWYAAFLSEEPGIEDKILRGVKYLLANSAKAAGDFSHPDILYLSQTAKKVHREKHRMEAFVRFRKTADEIYFAGIEPDFDVLPLIKAHFFKRYADQRWLIYDERRNYGLFYDLKNVIEIELTASPLLQSQKNDTAIFEADEEMYQRLWLKYFKSVNIADRKNTRLHIQHMPRRYWKHLPEKFLDVSMV